MSQLRSWVFWNCEGFEEFFCISVYEAKGYKGNAQCAFHPETARKIGELPLTASVEDAKIFRRNYARFAHV